MFDEILVAIDFSDPSVDALDWTLDRYPDAAVTLFHALERTDPPAYVRRALDEAVDIGREEELDARSNLEALAQDRGLEGRTLLREGWPPAAVNSAAEECGADLIVVAAHRRQVWPGDEPPGATAEAIVERARVPVLIWRDQVEPTTERPTVMACLDLREGTERVPEVAAGVARSFGARLVLLHVVAGTLYSYLRAVSSPAKAEDSMRSIQRSAREEAERRVPGAAAEQLEVQTVVERGRPNAQILATAETEAADLIVMGKSHAAGADAGLLGGVTGKVVRGSNSSVLVVPLGGAARGGDA